MIVLIVFSSLFLSIFRVTVFVALGVVLRSIESFSLSHPETACMGLDTLYIIAQRDSLSHLLGDASSGSLTSPKAPSLLLRKILSTLRIALQMEAIPQIALLEILLAESSIISRILKGIIQILATQHRLFSTNNGDVCTVHIPPDEVEQSLMTSLVSELVGRLCIKTPNLNPSSAFEEVWTYSRSILHYFLMFSTSFGRLL